MSRMRRLLVMGSTACLALLSGCSSSPPAEQVANFGRTLRGLGDASRLTPAEWTAYQADQRYLHGLARPDVRVRLNLADPAQYRFALARLKLAGKTPENSPYLFEAMEARHRDHLAQGLAPGLLSPEAPGLAESAGRKEMHAIEAANAGETTKEVNDGLGVSTSTFPGGTYYTYTDTNYTDSTGHPLSQLAWAEEFDKGTNLTVPTNANLGLTGLGRYRVSSYKVEDSVEGFKDSYIYSEFGSPPGTTSTRPGLSAITVQAPVDTVLNDNLISVCLNRTWTQDCDYDLTGTPQAIKLPLKGQLSLTTAHLFDQAKINQFKADLTAGMVTYDVGHLKLILTNAGGGCDVTDGNLIEARMSQFWDRATLSADQKTFSWDLTGAYAAFFDDECRQVQDEVKLTLKIVLPIVASAGGAVYQSSVTLSNDRSVPRPDYTFKKITVTNSCLAAGTEIELAEGKVAPVESLKAGDRVSNPHQPTLTVMDTAIGVETVPMVRIRSESGRSLLMTEMHPIQVLARGMVQARALKTGDVVMTKTGPSKLVAVSREPYAGKVYNVKVGSDAEKLALAADQTVVYANGFVVGDGQIQQKYESVAMTKQNENVLATLPAKWHRDYQLAGKRK
ncbi:Hint domain-containing protein [Myxococcus qinghaiensis]|uniref:Hint domain-containing protein n=1 Tax=Myxococcus qinghaiensis TaxID=2906758 RepID=UPI0020A7CFE6|nr:Hint domain-containing protein [Myxococcus qinghaiensis]MCP3164497.1 Hint domain-containing protein [Myxococcus qinghaiensis]